MRKVIQASGMVLIMLLALLFKVVAFIVGEERLIKWLHWGDNNDIEDYD